MRMWRRLAGLYATAMGKTRKSFYAVRTGRNVGVYSSWEECETQVKRYPGAVYKGFTSKGEAESFAYPSQATSAARDRYAGSFPSTSVTHTRSSSRYSCWKQDDSDHRSAPVVYTDGCCFGNGRRNATAGVGVYWGPESSHNISEKLTGNQTNQRAEVVSASRALESAISQGMKSVEVRTDSAYTIKAMTEWVGKWKQNGWQTVQNEGVKNKEDLAHLDSLCQQIDVKWTHVPGHRGIAGNEAADSLAKAGSLK